MPGHTPRLFFGYKHKSPGAATAAAALRWEAAATVAAPGIVCYIFWYSKKKRKYIKKKKKIPRRLRRGFLFDIKFIAPPGKKFVSSLIRAIPIPQ